MDMNMRALREKRQADHSHVVLYQSDRSHPMNPHGLLMAYNINGSIRLVTGSFSAITFGRRGTQWFDALPAEQGEEATWCLAQAAGILQEPGADGWHVRWLEVLCASGLGHRSVEAAEAFGDSATRSLVAGAQKATEDVAAVHAGLECFNYHHPQEFGAGKFLVVWRGSEDSTEKPWLELDAAQLQRFLLQRAKEGFSFPLHPVWPVRDKGWYEVFEALEGQKPKSGFQAWYPGGSDIAQSIKALHKEFPDGFYRRMAHTQSSPCDGVIKDLNEQETVDLV